MINSPEKSNPAPGSVPPRKKIQRPQGVIAQQTAKAKPSISVCPEVPDVAKSLRRDATSSSSASPVPPSKRPNHQGLRKRSNAAPIAEEPKRLKSSCSPAPSNIPEPLRASQARNEAAHPKLGVPLRNSSFSADGGPARPPSADGRKSKNTSQKPPASKERPPVSSSNATSRAALASTYIGVKSIAVSAQRKKTEPPRAVYQVCCVQHDSARAALLLVHLSDLITVTDASWDWSSQCTD